MDNQDSPTKLFGEYMEEIGICSAEQVARGLEYAACCGKWGRYVPLGQALVELGYATQDKIDQALAIQASERREAERRLRALEEKYRTLVEDINDGYLAIQSDNVVFANKKAVQILGRPREEVTGPLRDGPLIERLTLESRMKFSQVWERIKCGGAAPRAEEFELLMGDGTTTPVEIRFNRTTHDGRSAYSVLMADITERKRAEEDKKRMSERLFQAQKMEAIGLLAGGIAHDFNNVLGVIQGYTELGMTKVEKGDPLCRDLEKIHSAAVSAASITRQLLFFSRKQAITFTMLDLNRTISPLLKMIERLVGNDISINASLQPDLWPVSADPGSIERVIMNLTINARDAMPKGGAILIKSQNMVIDEKTSVSIPEVRPGRYVCLSVADSGVGMTRETVQRIFEPFFTTKAAGKGSGLGLSVVYGIVQQHAGWINVSSELGQGSTFRVYLPALPEGAVIAEKESGAGLEVLLR